MSASQLQGLHRTGGPARLCHAKPRLVIKQAADVEVVGPVKGSYLLCSALGWFPVPHAILLGGVHRTVRGKPPMRIATVTSVHFAALVTACAALSPDGAEAARLHCTTLSHVRSNAEGRIEEANPADPLGLTWQTFDFDTSTLILTNALSDGATYSQKLQKGLLNTSEFVGFFRIGASPIGMLHISQSSTPMTFSLYRIRDFLSGVCERLEDEPESSKQP